MKRSWALFGIIPAAEQPIGRKASRKTYHHGNQM